MGIILKHLKSLTSHPTAMLIPDMKSANALFYQILHLLPFEPSLAAKLQQSLMPELLQYLRAATSTYITNKYKSLQYASYILQVI